MRLQDLHRSKGAQLAPDGIPLHYGDLLAEYNAALNSAVIFDRSHEGRIQLFGKDRFDLLNRMSTNKMVEMQPGEGRPTIFTNANARIIDRLIAYNRDDHLLLITEPGQSAPMAQFLQRHIFFNDDARLVDITARSAQFALHGPHADSVMIALAPDAVAVAPLHSLEFTSADATIFAGRRKTLSGTHWVIVTPLANAVAVYKTILEAGADYDLLPAGSLTFNMLRIRAGQPARPELNTDYIPLEVGLWDEVHFAKGCYTGQEIIARMESRAKLAKTIVALSLSEFVPAPAQVKHEGRTVGKLTSSVQTPTGEIFALAIIKIQAIAEGTALTIGDKDYPATVKGLVGEQPDYIT